MAKIQKAKDRRPRKARALRELDCWQAYTCESRPAGVGAIKPGDYFMYKRDHDGTLVRYCMACWEASR